MTTEWQTVIRNTSNCRSVIGTLTPTVYLWAIQSLGMDGRTAHTKNCALSHSTHSTCVHRRFCLRSLRCLALWCLSSRCSADTAQMQVFQPSLHLHVNVCVSCTSKIIQECNDIYLYIYIFMIVDVLFNAYTSRYVAVGNTEIRNTQAFWETTELSTTTTSFVCTVFFKVWIGKVPLKWRLICLFTSYPKHKSAIRIPRMKRLTGTHHYTALVLLALLQGSLFARKPSLMRCFRMPFHILEVMMSLFDESRNDERFLFFCDMFNMFYLLSM